MELRSGSRRQPFCSHVAFHRTRVPLHSYNVGTSSPLTAKGEDAMSKHAGGSRSEPCTQARHAWTRTHARTA